MGIKEWDMDCQTSRDPDKTREFLEQQIGRLDKLHARLPLALKIWRERWRIWRKAAEQYGEKNACTSTAQVMVNRKMWDVVACGVSLDQISDLQRLMEDDGAFEDYVQYQMGFPT